MRLSSLNSLRFCRTEEGDTDSALSEAGVSLKTRSVESRSARIDKGSIERLGGSCAAYFCSGPRTSRLPCRASAADRHPPAEVPITSRCPPRLPALHRPLLSIRPPAAAVAAPPLPGTRFAQSVSQSVSGPASLLPQPPIDSHQTRRRGG